MKKISAAFLIIISLTIPAFAAWEKPAQPPSNGLLDAVVPDPWTPGKIIVASRDGLFSGYETGPWDKFSPGDIPKNISRLFCFREIPDSVFLLSQEGAFECSLKSQECRRFLRSSGSSPAPLTFAVDPEDADHWFAGTGKGLLESDDRGKTWFPFSSFRNDAVTVVHFHGGALFVGAGNALFLSKDRAHFRRVFSLLQQGASEEETFSEVSEETPAEFRSGLHEIVSVPEKNSLWLAASKGVFKSMDAGLSWKSMPSSGLQTTDVRHLVYSPHHKQIYAGTAKGVFGFDPESDGWKKMYAGLEKEFVSGMALAVSETREMLVTITSAGFFFFPVFPDQVKPAIFSETGDTPQLFRKLVQLEPQAWEIQKESVAYANARNGKIKRWHAESRLAALLPNLSFGKDFSRGNSIDIDRRGTNEADFYIAGPDDIDKGWDFDVSWDLGDFIYSSDQTSIDSREKLMVELRNDILAEVTRIYYERRRLQMDLAFNPAASELEHYEKVLRVDELTALLDGFTGKFLSRKLRDLYLMNPDLEQLWEFRGAAEAKT